MPFPPPLRVTPRHRLELGHPAVGGLEVAELLRSAEGDKGSKSEPVVVASFLGDPVELGSQRQIALGGGGRAPRGEGGPEQHGGRPRGGAGGGGAGGRARGPRGGPPPPP